MVEQSSEESTGLLHATQLGQAMHSNVGFRPTPDRRQTAVAPSTASQLRHGHDPTAAYTSIAL